MNNKKVLITIIIAGVLALALVLLIFSLQNKKETPEKPLKIEQEESELKPETEPVKEPKAEKEIETPKIQPQKPPVKQTSALKKHAEKKISKPAPKPQDTIKPAVEKVEIPQDVQTEKLEEGVVIPVEYTTKNTYKYVYTPAKYSEK